MFPLRLSTHVSSKPLVSYLPRHTCTIMVSWSGSFQLSPKKSSHQDSIQFRSLISRTVCADPIRNFIKTGDVGAFLRPPPSALDAAKHNTGAQSEGPNSAAG